MENKFSRVCPNTFCNKIIFYKYKGDVKSANEKETLCKECRYLEINKRDDKILGYLKNSELTHIEIAKKIGTTKHVIKKVVKKNKIKRKPKLSNEGRKTKSNIFRKNILDKKLNVFGGIKDKKHYEKIFKSRYGLDYSKFKEIQPEFIKYRNKVRGVTNKNLKKYSHLFNNLDDIGRCGDKGKFQIDHRISIKDGFKFKLPYHLIAHPSNLQVIKWEDNLNKSTNSDITLDEFITKSSEFLTLNNKIYI